MLKLIGSMTSPYVRKVRIVMAEKKLDYEFEIDDPWSQQTRVSDSNPLGKVPCLVLDGGEALFDSRVIVEYLDTLSPVGRLIPATGGRARAEVKAWEALADGLLEAGVLARMEAVWPHRTPEQRSPAWIERQRGKMEAAVQAMSRGLGEQPFCAGERFTLADVAVGAALGWLEFRMPELSWRTQYPNLARLQDKLMQRPSFADTAPR